MRKPAAKSKPAPARASAAGMGGRRFPVWLIGALLALVTMALYWPATGHDFVNYDDDLHVTSNVHVQSGLTWEGMKWAFSNPVNSIWHPVTMGSHMLDCQLFGLKPWGHHLTSVVLHALNAALVFVWLQQMTGAAWRSLLVAALFAVHPLRVESVAWVAERKDVLSAFFGLLCLWAYARYAEIQSLKQSLKSEVQSLKSDGRSPMAEVRSPKSEVRSPKSEVRSPKSEVRSLKSDGRRPKSDGRSQEPESRKAQHASLFYLLSLFFFALGLMSKPVLVTWPFAMLLLDYWPLRRMQKEEGRRENSDAGFTLDAPRSRVHALLSLVTEKVPFFALSAAAGVVTLVVQKQGGALAAGEHLSLGARSGNALISYWRYLGKLFWPTDLAVFYPHPGHWPLAKVLLAGGLMLGISGLMFAQGRRFPFLLMGWLWYGGTLAPMIQVVQTGGHAMADRYSYLPSLGVLILAVWGGYELSRRWRPAVLALSVGGSAAIVACMVLTRHQLGYWKDSEALFRHALEVTEDNYLVRYNLGTALDKKGEIGEAISQFEEAIRLKPDDAEPHNNLGMALGENGQMDEAIGQFEEALHLRRDYADAHNNLGNALARKGQIGEAIRQFEEVIRLEPDDAGAYYNLGNTLAEKGQLDEAIRQFEAAIRLKPDDAIVHNNLGIAFARQNRVDEAIRQFQEAVRLKPDYAGANNNLARALEMKHAPAER